VKFNPPEGMQAFLMYELDEELIVKGFEQLSGIGVVVVGI
jgi:hypothetical protein